jgi:hypothetical protein
MTKTEYRAYIASRHWQSRRKKFLTEFSACERCGLYRWLAIIAYDQDLHLHHNSYLNLGAELDEDLSALCKRCHEIETFGTSSLHQVRSKPCENVALGCCGFDGLVFNVFETKCLGCLDIQQYFHAMDVREAFKQKGTPHD